MKTDEQLERILAMLSENNQGISDLKAAMKEMTVAKDEFDIWKPEVEKSVTDLQSVVADLGTRVEQLTDLGTRVEQLACTNSPSGKSSSRVNDTKETNPKLRDPKSMPVTADLVTSSKEAASGPHGHHVNNYNRGPGFGVVYTTPPPPPVTGTIYHSQHPKFGDTQYHGQDPPPNFSHAFPPIPFPQFDGTNPKLWIRKCETFFDIYSVPKHLQIPLATMNFIGSAGFWLQTMQSKVLSITWEELCSAICTRFDKDEENHLIRQFFRIRQTNSVSEYIENFGDLIHQLLIHTPNISHSVITNRFLDGLKDDIKVVVVVHRPQDLDAASSLALLQEEVCSEYSKREYKKFEASSSSYHKRISPETGKSSNSSLPITPVKSVQHLIPEEKKMGDTAKLKPMEDRLVALKAFRRAKGLCYKCGEKWNPAYKCPSFVSLHAIEEIWQFCTDSPNTDPEDSDSTDDLCAISLQAVKGTESVKTIRLRSFIQKAEVYILVDSGSTHCFISEHIAISLPGWQPLSTPVQVQVANGGLLQCSHEIPNLIWGLQGQTFTTTFKILPLNNYDAILGMDWLESHSLMQVHWKEKWMQFQYNGKVISLQGVKHNVQLGPPISETQLKALIKSDSILYMIHLEAMEMQKVSESELQPEIQNLISQFAALFEEPKELPPPREGDHQIPLILELSHFVCVLIGTNLQKRTKLKSKSLKCYKKAGFRIAQAHSVPQFCWSARRQVTGASVWTTDT